MVTEDQVRKALRKVKDPELKIDLVVLGLIYDIRIDGPRRRPVRAPLPGVGRMVTEDQVRKALRKVKDPELKIDLVVLGLIYDIRIDGPRVDVTMSLTSPACPVAGEIVHQAREAVEGVEGVEEANVELTFSPPWTAERIPPLIRSALGL
jgi:metal-sulfur cluster biosynthetic enzyme